MQRITLSIDDELAELFDRFVEEKGYQSRSEAFRDLLRGEVRKEAIDADKTRFCVGVLSYVYNHHERQLASRLASMQHDHHDLTISTMHAHLDHDNCIETSILRGPTAEVSAFAQAIIAQTGVRHGRFYFIPVEMESKFIRRHPHVHLHPRT